MPDKPIKCRCVFCGDGSNVDGKLFIAGTRRYGKDRAVWGACNECLMICMGEITKHALKA